MDILCPGQMAIPLWMPLAFLCLSLTYLYGSFPMTTWKRLGIPGPPPVPFFGNAHEFFNAAIGVCASVTKWKEQYGKIIGIHFFRKPCLVITDIDALREIMVKKFNVFPDRFFLGGGKFFPDIVNRAMSHQKGDNWRRLRRIMSPTFTGVKLKLLASEMNRTARQLADVMSDYAMKDAQPEAKDVYSAFTLDVIARTAFGLNSNCLADRSDPFYQMATGLLRPRAGTKAVMAAVGMFPLTGAILQKIKYAMFSPESLAYLERCVGKLVSERKKNSGGFTTVDFLQLLIQAEVDPSEKIVGEKNLSEDEVVSQGIMFITAGFETTSSTLQYMSHVLAKHQHIQERVMKEMKEVVGQEKEITYEHCERMKYTEAVINETIRLHPPVHLVFREALRETTVKGVTIPAHAGILVPVYNVGQDTDLYSNPEIFNPDRFLGEEGRNNIGFGIGPKTCIGLRLAMMEIKIAFYHLLTKVRLVDATPDEIDVADYTAFATLKKPIMLTVEPRTGL